MHYTSMGILLFVGQFIPRSPAAMVKCHAFVAIFTVSLTTLVAGVYPSTVWKIYNRRSSLKKNPSAFRWFCMWQNPANGRLLEKVVVGTDPSFGLQLGNCRVLWPMAYRKALPGNSAGQCFQEFFWLSPSCRDGTVSCIMLFTGGESRHNWVLPPPVTAAKDSVYVICFFGTVTKVRVRGAGKKKCC